VKRALTAVAVLAMYLCARAQDAPGAAQVASGLPELQRARLEYLFAAMTCIDAAWPFAERDETCVLLLAPEAQWVANCEQAPAGFVRVPGAFRGRPLYARVAGSLNIGGHALTTQQWVERTAAAAHVDEPGVHGTDLPGQQPWLVLGSLEALVAYHAEFRECMTDEWLSVALHELFHTRQLRAPGFAPALHAINMGALDPKPLEALYTNDAGYRGRVRREYDLLVRAVEAKAPSRLEARRALRVWYALYRKRRADLSARANGAALLRSDVTFTYLEGLARYVESTFLVDTTLHPPATLRGDPRFDNFAKYAAGGYAPMPNRQLDAQYYYAIGFHLALLLDRVDPSWRQRVATQPDWLIGVAASLASPAISGGSRPRAR
jgi:hypothetical protein